MEIILREQTYFLHWNDLTSDQKAHMDKDFPSNFQHDRTFLKSPIPCDFVIPTDVFFGPIGIVSETDDGLRVYDYIFTTGGVAYLSERLNDGKTFISLAVV
jgi:hypothetical protein